MTRYSLSNEMDILNRIDEMNESLYKGKITEEDVKYSIKTIRNLLLEIYLLNKDGNNKIEDKNSVLEKLAVNFDSKLITNFEANKPI